ncbi:bifunctional riboflavin kinase/FAD synthetase [Cellulomonas sp. ATA003]|uniref:bifunctional riboflavin kinase/FAD synthetase n=1 Tax=Cellulomonas sp. ATA003 TaxID=3073064 RepID=UPI002873EB71|nr:bifunctional riboflavin kinase/FAD synthetase [Cellulomonas sp. ATA003]WNB84903.1 bifunctional riboflavin kinase/FAD synthetase [Cellulomonas sp. ATA003]
MHRWTDLGQVPQGYGPSVVTLGNFDGVHRGHRSVLARMVADARSAGARAVVVTFDPHPAQVHHPQDAPPLLTGVHDRLELLGQTGLDAVLVLPYTLDFARQSPEEFVRRYLVEALGARTVVVGRDVRFGWENAGDLATMTELGERFGFAVEVIEDQAAEPEPADGARTHVPDGANGADRADDDDVARAEVERLRRVAEPLHRRWSSTWVRELLAAGRVAEAADVLGRPHRVRGEVVHGDARGRELGYPTANLAPSSAGMVPADGVYAGWLHVTREPLPGFTECTPEIDAVKAADAHTALPGPRLPAAISVGTNPTFDGVGRRVEAYVLDRTDLDLYDREVVVEFVARIRPTLRFESVTELVATMDGDVERVRAALDAAGPPDGAAAGTW